MGRETDTWPLGAEQSTQGGDGWVNAVSRKKHYCSQRGGGGREYHYCGDRDMEVEVSTATANVEANAVVPGCGTSAMAKAAAAANLYSR